MTFLRRNGSRDSGRPHDPARPSRPALMDLEEYRAGLDDWLDDHTEALTPRGRGPGRRDGPPGHGASGSPSTPAGRAGDGRSGWAGLGGSTLLRAYLGEAFTARGLVEPGIYSMTETLAPTMIDYAAPELAGTMVPRLLRGDETWCQGFSEPEAGSNLASLSCRAVRTDEGWRVTGQKVWTSLAQYAQRCVLLVRTGSVESAHRGITALFVDMDAPGISVRPIETMHGEPEFSEVFFDDVAVPFDRTLGEEGQGWSVAMDLLPYERSTALWHRAAFLQRRFGDLLEEAADGDLDPEQVGEAAHLLYAFRARSRATQHRMAAGDHLGPGDLGRQGAGGHGRAGGLRRGGGRPRPVGGRSATTRQRSAGGASTSSPGRPPSTAAARRSSATSSPAGCSSWPATADGRRRSRAVPAHAARRHGRAGRDTGRRRRGRASGGTTRWTRTAVRRSPCCSRPRARSTPARRRSTTWWAASWRPAGGRDRRWSSRRPAAGAPRRTRRGKPHGAGARLDR